MQFVGGDRGDGCGLLASIACKHTEEIVRKLSGIIEIRTQFFKVLRHSWEYVKSSMSAWWIAGHSTRMGRDASHAFGYGEGQAGSCGKYVYNNA